MYITGNLVQRVTYHTGYHLGQVVAVRRRLGHAKELATTTGASMTEIVTEALRERWRREQRAAARRTPEENARLVEVGAVVDGARDPIVSRRFDELLEMFEVVIEPVTPGQAHRAREAYRDFGRGSGHPARLDYGDVFSYALTTERRAPLLFKGADFTHTDVIDARA